MRGKKTKMREVSIKIPQYKGRFIVCRANREEDMNTLKTRTVNYFYILKYNVL